MGAAKLDFQRKLVDERQIRTETKFRGTRLSSDSLRKGRFTCGHHVFSFLVGQRWPRQIVLRRAFVLRTTLTVVICILRDGSCE